MARHGDSWESRFRQNFKKKFDWCAFNSGMLLADRGQRVAIALDHSFLSKSGKKTPGLGRYWSGCAGTIKRGLEILGFAQVAAGVRDARFLFAVQTMPLSTKGRTPCFLEHMKENRDNQTAKCLRAISDHKEQLLAISDILVGDCLFASYNFVTGAVKLGFNRWRRGDTVQRHSQGKISQTGNQGRNRGTQMRGQGNKEDFFQYRS